MSIVEQQAFVTEDGRIFFTREEAAEHEESLLRVEEVGKYIKACEAAGISPRTAARRSSAILQYLDWLKTGTIAQQSTPDKPES